MLALITGVYLVFFLKVDAIFILGHNQSSWNIDMLLLPRVWNVGMFTSREIINLCKRAIIISGKEGQRFRG